MTPTAPNAPRIAFVTSRALDGESMAGRLHIAQAIRAVLRTHAQLAEYRLPSVLTDFTVGRGLRAVLAYLWYWLRGPALPLQCALFADPLDRAALLRRLPVDLDAIYIDGVRGYPFLQTLRRKRPDLHIVVDLDDLMSRRMDLLLEAEQPLSPGYLTKRLPGPLRRLIMSRRIGRLVVLYERWALRAVERRICELADAVVLLSEADAETLRKNVGRQRADIVVIPPPSRPAVAVRPFETPARFVFVGSDALTQNRLTIDYLIEFWRRGAIPTPLVLYGLRYRTLALPPRVQAMGYVDAMNEIYDGQSVLITPSMIGGGIKTKVLEAFAYGAPVVGNAVTFESMPLGAYPLQVSSDTDLEQLVRAPVDHLERFRQGAAQGAAYIAAHHAPDVFAQQWRAQMTPKA